MKRSFQLLRGMALLAVLAMGFSACGSGVQFVREDMTAYPPKPSNATIEVYDGEIMQPHVVIGTMIAEKTMKGSFGDQSTFDEVLVMLKKEARKVGADAIIGVKPVTAESGMSSRVQVKAKAVRFLEQSTTVGSSD